MPHTLTVQGLGGPATNSLQAGYHKYKGISLRIDFIVRKSPFYEKLSMLSSLLRLPTIYYITILGFVSYIESFANFSISG
jgi:hypothetical protein